MTQPEREDFLTTQGVAEVLGVSAMRVRQMITEGKLPAPTNLGTRFYVWHRADIDAVKGVLAGGDLTPPSAMLSPPAKPLSRVRDEVLTVVTGWEPGTRPVHVRVWQGPAPEGPRTVVLLGEMFDGVPVRSQLEAILRVVAPLLPAVSAARTVWFEYLPGGVVHPHEVNQRMWREPDVPEPTLGAGAGRIRHLFHRAGRPGPGGWADAVPKLSRPATLAEVERVVGSAVEAYPPQAYTREAIEAWRRGGRIVGVRHDAVDYDSLMGAAHTLSAARADTTDTADVARREVLGSAVHLLVDDVRGRLAYIDKLRWEDGTTPGPGVKGSPSWPTRWAARLVKLRPSPADEALFAAWPDSFPIGRDTSRHAPLHTLLGGLRAWARQVDPYAEHPDPTVYTALQRAASLLAFYLGVYDREFADRDHPDTVVRVHEARGSWDRRYLDALIPVPDGADPDGADREHARSRRILSARLRPLLLRPNTPGMAGLDCSGRLVLHYPGEGREGCALFAVEWPLRPPPAPIAAGTRIVADAHPSERPVYLAYPNGHLDLLPAPPGTPQRGWGFGYDGSDTQALIEAVITTFTRADALTRDQVPEAWIRDQIVYAPPEQPLDIAVDELRRRYRTVTSAHARHDRRAE